MAGAERPTIEDVTYLTEELLLPFYEVERDMALPIEERRQEKDAEHSWSVAVLACALAPEVDTGLDVGLVAQFGITHDIVERYAGDTSVWGSAEDLESKEERERQAVDTIATNFSQFPWLAETIAAYERQDTPEARFVKSVDKTLAMVIRYIDEGKYYRERGLTFEKWSEGLEVVEEKAHGHPVAGEYYDDIKALIAIHPEWFFQPE